MRCILFLAIVSIVTAIYSFFFSDQRMSSSGSRRSSLVSTDNDEDAMSFSTNATHDSNSTMQTISEESVKSLEPLKTIDEVCSFVHSALLTWLRSFLRYK